VGFGDRHLQAPGRLGYRLSAAARFGYSIEQITIGIGPRGLSAKDGGNRVAAAVVPHFVQFDFKFNGVTQRDV